MQGLELINEGLPTREVRQEFKMLRDEYAYKAVSRHASVADMREIDGWARSFYTLEGHLESIAQYHKPLLPEPRSYYWLEAKRIVLDEVAHAFPPVRSFRFERDFDLVPIEASSAAGYGYQGKKGEANNFKRAKNIANALVRTFAEHKAESGEQFARDHVINNSTPDVAFTRTQLAKLPTIKVRNVFGEAFHYILIEGLSASPLLEGFKRADTFYVTGKDPTSYVPKYLYQQQQQPGWFIALDWSKFDATVQLWEIDHAFNCIEQLLIFPSDLTREAFEVSKILFKHRKLSSPDGLMWMRNSGIPSGSYFTNLIGSIINYTRVQYLCRTMGYTITSCRVQGDDSIIKVTSDAKPNVLAMASTVAELGWVLNPTKCVVTLNSEEVTFLGRSQLQLFNIRERLKILRLMSFPEFEVDDPKISTTRVRMIARDAGFRDPLYNKIVFEMIALYGEADYVPRHLLSYVDLIDWQDVNM
nr:RNA-dependent RNA polymerase [Carrot cryptic virus 3]